MDVLQHGTFNTRSPPAGFLRYWQVTNLLRPFTSDFTPHIHLNAFYPHAHSEGADTDDFC